MKNDTTCPFFSLASAMAKTELSNEEKDRCAQMLRAMEAPRQQVFFDYCKKWKVAPMLHTTLKKNGWLPLLHTSVAQQFAAVHQKVQLENERRNKEAVLFLREFKRRGIEVAVLKGNLLIHTVYHDTGYKKMNDFDLLIHPKDWSQAQQVYDDLGYIPLGFGWGGEKEKPAKFSHVGMSFISPNYRCIIGTQWGLKSPTSRYRVNMEELWANTRPFDFYGVEVRQLSPGHNLLHLILHMGVHKCGIRDCMDVFNLLLSRPHWDEDRLIALIHESNATAKAYFTLCLANLCSGTLSPSLLAKLKPQTRGYISKRLENRLRLHAKTGDFQDAYHDYFQQIEINLFYFNIFPKTHHKAARYWKILQLIFWPKQDMALRFSDLPPGHSFWQKTKARAVAPFLVFSLIAEEIGWTFTLLLFVKLGFDLLASLKNYFIKKQSYFAYLKSRSFAHKNKR